MYDKDYVNNNNDNDDNDRLLVDLFIYLFIY